MVSAEQTTLPATKSDAGTGRTIPMNQELFFSATEYAKWYTSKFGESKTDWYVFPFGKPFPQDPTRPQTSLKTAWRNVRAGAKVEGRFHDNRHTFVTDLSESGAGDQVIQDMAGHVSRDMVKHYSHIRTEAKRRAVGSHVPNGRTERRKQPIFGCGPTRSPTSQPSELRTGVCKSLNNLAPQVGFEPTTLRLTAECSAIELLRSITPTRTQALLLARANWQLFY